MLIDKPIHLALDTVTATYRGVKFFAFDKYNKQEKRIDPDTVCLRVNPGEFGAYPGSGGFFKDVSKAKLQEYYGERFTAVYAGIRFEMSYLAVETREVKLLSFAERRKIGKAMAEIGIVGNHYDRDLDYYETTVPLSSLEQICRVRRDFLSGGTSEEIITADEFWAAVIHRA